MIMPRHTALLAATALAGLEYSRTCKASCPNSHREGRLCGRDMLQNNAEGYESL